jgi:glycosyltransferase involved in cell wall biosynthesis
VIAPSEDAARRVRRPVPGLAISVEPPEPEPSAGSSPRARPGALVRICIAGAIGVPKGYNVLLAAARDAAERDLSLAFSVVGHTIDDAPLLETGRVFVTGPYAPGEAEELIRAERADLGLLPSVAPETWCFALGELWRAGLDVVAFDLGAQAERIRHTGRGFLLPSGLPAPALNDALLATGRRSGHECRALAQP